MGAARERELAQSRCGACLGARPLGEELEETRAADKIVVANVAVGPCARGWRAYSPDDPWSRVGEGEAVRVRGDERLWAARPARPDRWAALIGAWSILPRAVPRCHAGTATTVDVLRGDGRFVGGVILPGLDLMKRSLARGTANFRLQQGAFPPSLGIPRMPSKPVACSAQAGVIERAFAAMERGAACVLAGEAARRIARTSAFRAARG